MLVKNLGNLSVADAKLNEFGEIDVSSAENLQIITERVGFRAISAVLVEYDGWGLVVEIEVPDELHLGIEKDLVFEIENQTILQKLNAFL